MKFEFNIGGYPGPFFNVEYANNHLLVSHGMYEDKVPMNAVIPLEDNQAWEDVLVFLATRKWHGDYILAGCVDGTNWELRFTQGTQIEAHGSNKYPPGFKKFLTLLNRVTYAQRIRIY